jgi:hypothetical protein
MSCIGVNRTARPLAPLPPELVRLPITAFQPNHAASSPAKVAALSCPCDVP